MGFAAILFLIIGVPLLLVAIGFVVLVTKVFGGTDARAESAQTLEAARHLERTLSTLENRLSALEDVIMSTDSRGKGGENE